MPLQLSNDFLSFKDGCLELPDCFRRNGVSLLLQGGHVKPAGAVMFPYPVNGEPFVPPFRLDVGLDPLCQKAPCQDCRCHGCANQIVTNMEKSLVLLAELLPAHPGYLFKHAGKFTRRLEKKAKNPCCDA